jgi:hypothetical protein
MRKNNIRIRALVFVVPILFVWLRCVAAQAAKAPYPVMAPVDQYLIPNEKAEIALARSAAPIDFGCSRSDGVVTGRLRNCCKGFRRLRLHRRENLGERHG